MSIPRHFGLLRLPPPFRGYTLSYSLLSENGTESYVFALMGPNDGELKRASEGILGRLGYVKSETPSATFTASTTSSTGRRGQRAKTRTGMSPTGGHPPTERMPKGSSPSSRSPRRRRSSRGRVRGSGSTSPG